MLTLLIAMFGYLFNAFGYVVIEDGTAMFMAYCCETLLTVFAYGFWRIWKND